jgi:hypothetical protein
MFIQQSIKKGYIVVLHCAQIDVFVDWLIEALVLHVSALYLFLDILIAWWQESDKIEIEALPPGESRSLVQ